MIINERYEIDELADAAGGYFAMPSADELAYTELLFDVCGKATRRKDRGTTEYPPCIYRVKENMYMPAGRDLLPAGFF